jgi:hypothetical protein
MAAGKRWAAFVGGKRVPEELITLTTRGSGGAVHIHNSAYPRDLTGSSVLAVYGCRTRRLRGHLSGREKVAVPGDLLFSLRSRSYRRRSPSRYIAYSWSTIVDLLRYTEAARFRPSENKVPGEFQHQTKEGSGGVFAGDRLPPQTSKRKQGSGGLCFRLIACH